jgi:hypothetical protein
MCSAGLLNIRTSGWKNYSPPTGENNQVAICTSPDGYGERIIIAKSGLNAKRPALRRTGLFFLGVCLN